MAESKSSKPATVAVIGAGGIGKHHVNWWRLNGVRVCAIVGTSVGSVMETAAMLRDLFGFDGEGYLDVDQMLREQQPDCLDVCSPPGFHAEQVQAGLEAGAHVLCEKPFLYASNQSPAEQLQITDDLLAMAGDAGLQLSLCSQHVVTAETCLRLYREQNGDQPVSRVKAILASPLRGDPDSGEAVWIDLGPHLLAAAQAIAPRAKLDPESMDATFMENDAQCSFRLKMRDGETLDCECRAFRTTGEPTHVRKIVLNDVCYELAGERGNDDIYMAKITGPQGALIENDPMRQLIQRFIDGNPLLAGHALRRNHQWLLEILERGATA